MNRSCVAVMLLVACAGIAPAQKPPAPQKRRVAVMRFGYGTVRSSVQAIFGTDSDVGKGISDMAIDHLLKDGTYRVIDREMLDKLIQEQNFSNSDRADPSTAAKIGRLLGVDTMVVGDVTQFGRDDHNTSAAGALGSWDHYGISRLGMKKAKAVVAITARMIDVSTGEVLASESGRGTSQRSGTSLLGAGGGDGGGGGGGMSMSSSNFAQTILGEAVTEAISTLCTALDGDSAKLPVSAPPVMHIKGEVADFTDGVMVVNVGTKDGVKVGDHLEVTRTLRTIRDPATGKVLRSIDQKLGEFTVTSVDANSAMGSFSGTGAPKVSDIVKTIGD
ncbi:MAG TPA: CsgG/HfaB family protein [Bryobacteraceae bacterium]|nr:CsgG/HfaB family protein [Bryobacteraceae bacterium]